MDIRVISPSQALPLRRALLFPDRVQDRVDYPGDIDDRALHLGLFIGVSLVGIASFLPEDLPERPGGFRLRGLAIAPAIQRRGMARAMVERGVEELKKREAAYIWANAKLDAVSFYEKLGFRTISDLFDIPGIGMHRRVVLPLSSSSGQAQGQTVL